MKKRKGYISLEIMIICFAILTAGITGLIHFSKKSKVSYSGVEKIEEQIFEQVAYTPWHPGGGGQGGSGGPGGPGGSEGGSEATYYTIAFDGNGGSHTTRDVVIGQPVGNLPVSVRNGYTFMGWYDSASGGNKVTKDTIPTANTVYYAHWTPTQYKINYDLNGGSVVNPGSYTLESDTFTLGKPTKQYYEFIGWTGSNGTVPMLEVTIEKGSTGEKQYVANYIPNAYTVVYSETDSSLSFYNLNENIVQGKEFNGKMSTNVYMVSKDEIFSSENLTPWYKDHATDIKYVDVIEEIQPRNTAYWFYGLTNCSVFDLNKLNAVNTVDMSYMFKDVASNVKGVQFGEINQYTGDKLELNEYGFFYDVTYKATIPGYDNVEYCVEIHEDGSAEVLVTMEDQIAAQEQFESGQMAYEVGKVTFDVGTASEMIFYIVENGFAFQMDDLNFVIDYEKHGYQLTEMNEYGFYYGNYSYYSYTDTGELNKLTLSFDKEGNLKLYENNNLIESYAKEELVYETRSVTIDGMKLYFNNDGSIASQDSSTYNIIYINFNLEYSSVIEYTGLEFTNLSNKLTLETPNAVKMESMFEGCTTITDLDLSNFDMTKTTVATNMFKNMLRLQEITFGENWKWVGTDGYLPTPDSKYIKGADGNWYDLNDNPYISNKVPNGEGTYVAGGKNEYAVFSMDDYSLSFYNTRKEIKVGDIYNGKLANAVYTDFIEDEVNALSSEGMGTYLISPDSPWVSIAPQVLKVYVVDEIVPTDTSFWFYNFINCELFDIQKLNMEKVVDAQWMFAHAEKTKELNVSHWKLENLEIAWRMFGWCNGLTELNLSEFTGGPNLVDISYMFADSANLKKIDLSNLDASAVTDADYIFDELNYLEEITFGPKWKFINKRGYLPTPSSTYIPDANGCWHSEDGTTYTPSALATAYNADRAGMAGTYYASKPEGLIYAVYSDDDKALNFYDSSTAIKQGMTFDERTVTNVYPILATTTYSEDSLTPWYKEHAEDIKSVKVVNEIEPTCNTAYWFYGLTNCSVFDIEKLNTVNVTDMSYMFKNVGSNVDGMKFGKIEKYSGKKLELNDHGFFYDVTYKASIPEYNVEFNITIHENDSIELSEVYNGNNTTEQFDASQVSYSDGQILITNNDGGIMPFYIVNNGYNLLLAEYTFGFDYKQYAYQLHGKNEYGFYYGKYSYYTVDYETEAVEKNSFVFNEDGTVDLYNNDVFIEKYPSEMVVYGSNLVKIDGVTLYFNKEGTSISTNANTYAGMSIEPVLILEYSSHMSYIGLEYNDLNYKLPLNTSNVENMESMFEGCTTTTGLDLSTFNMLKIENNNNMFKDMLRLREITLGENWKWVGNNGYLPKPDINYIPDSDGYWYDLNSNQYNPENIPDGKGTYMTGGKEPFAIYSEDDKSLSFYNRNTKPDIGDVYNGKVVTAIFTDFMTSQIPLSTYGLDIPDYWGVYTESILRVDVYDEIAPLDTSYWFNGLTNCKIFNLNELNMDNVVRAEFMFYNCDAVTELNLSTWTLKNVDMLWNAFRDCDSLMKLDLSNATIENATDIDWIFAGNVSLKEIDLSNMNFKNVSSDAANNLFKDNNKLEKITLGPNWKWFDADSYLPVPNPDYITGADGNWYSEDGTGYTPEELAIAYNADPVGMAGTYYASINLINTQE